MKQLVELLTDGRLTATELSRIKPNDFAKVAVRVNAEMPVNTEQLWTKVVLADVDQFAVAIDQEPVLPHGLTLGEIIGIKRGNIIEVMTKGECDARVEQRLQQLTKGEQ